MPATPVMLDRAKPYGTITGKPADGARYTQGGRRFTAQEALIRKRGRKPKPVSDDLASSGSQRPDELEPETEAIQPEHERPALGDLLPSEPEGSA